MALREEIGVRVGYAGSLFLAMGLVEWLSDGGFSAWVCENLLRKPELMIGGGLIAIVIGEVLMRLESNSGQADSG